MSCRPRNIEHRFVGRGTLSTDLWAAEHWAQICGPRNTEHRFVGRGTLGTDLQAAKYWLQAAEHWAQICRPRNIEHRFAGHGTLTKFCVVHCAAAGVRAAEEAVYLVTAAEAQLPDRRQLGGRPQQKDHPAFCAFSKYIHTRTRLDDAQGVQG